MKKIKATNVEKLQFVGNRIMAQGLKVAAGILPVRDPKLLVGTNAINELAECIAGHGSQKVLLVTTAGIVRRGQSDELVYALEQLGITPVIFDGTTPDPTFEVVNAGLDLLRQENCDAVVAFGGGSAMDAAKVMAVAAANNCAPEKLVGYFKGRKKPLPLFVVPTTAGSGSEATIASVISDDRSHEKSFVFDSRTIPLAAALEPRLMENLSPSMTAATGMDALTHAIEAYISTISTRTTDRYAEEAVQLIFEHLPRACKNGSDLEAREAMSIASYKAGRAFTQASLGYVHAISHQMGAYYGTAHGLGNAIILPQVLDISCEAATPALARLAVLVGLGQASEDKAVLARKFVKSVRDLNREIGIPATIAALRQEDIAAIASGAQKEALFNYPVPQHMGRAQCEELLRSLLQSSAPRAVDAQPEALRAAA